MTTGREEICTPVFLDAPGRRLFALICTPVGEPLRCGVLVCPAFGEEMNRTRRTVRILAHQLCHAGIPLIEVDLHGTGDSSGEFADARWETWLEDLELGADRLMAAGCRSIVLLGIRGGSLLAWELLLRARHLYRAAILWQPVPNGRSIVTDLLRTRVAAGAITGRAENVTSLRSELLSGHAVEAAGYTLDPELVSALDSRSIAPADQPLPPVSWFEIGGDGSRALSGPILDRLRLAGIRTVLIRQSDPPFWGTTEITVGSATVARTLGVLRDLSA